MIVDLHTHSRYSDGADTLEALFQQAKQVGITHLGVVDHDTTMHHASGRELAKHYGLHFIAGVEISAYDFKRNRKVHMLGYSFQGECSHIEALCQPLLERRHAHSLWQLEKIQQAGFNISKQAALQFAKDGGTLYKQHLMNALTNEHYDSKNYQTLYKCLFKGTGVAAGDIRYIDAFDAMRAIHADGGVAVVAHPGQLNSFDIMEELAEQGLNGVEIIHPDHTARHIERILHLADKHELFTTGGSDYHGHYGTSIQLGQYTLPLLQIPYFVEQM